MYYDGWERLVTLAVVTTATYGFVVAVLRVSGKRTLSKLNAFDFIVTIALGSTLSASAVSRSLPLVDALLAVVVLVTLQLIVAVGARRWLPVRRLVRDSPRALLVHGEPLEEALAEERLTRAELAQAVRESGHGTFEDLDYVVLETDGTMTVVADAGRATALEGVRDADPRRTADSTR